MAVHPSALALPDRESAPSFELSLSNFEGPFDLLLTLISKHELDITEVSLSKITDEFIAFLKGLDGLEEMDQASEFLVIAATLLDLKIAELLPRGEVVDAEDVALLEARDLLFARLLQYRAFKEISVWFERAMAIESVRLAREVRLEERFRVQQPELVWTLSLDEFAALASQTLEPREIPAVGLTHLHAPRVSIREQASELVALLRAGKSLTFRELISGVTERPVVIARFLALLELYRMAAVNFEQVSPLSELRVAWQSENFSDEDLATLGADYES